MSKYDVIPDFIKQPPKNEPAPSEFIVNYDEEPNVINDTNEEIKTIKKAFMTDLQKEKKTKKDQVTANYYFTVYFQNETQKEEFFKKAGIKHLTGGLFVNGFDLAKAMGFEIKKEDTKKPHLGKKFIL